MQIQAERLVLAANGQRGLRTIALRPSGIFGEGDPLFVPSVINNARKGKMKFMIGNGRNLMDFTYVGNVAYSHILVRPQEALHSDTGLMSAVLKVILVTLPSIPPRQTCLWRA